MVIYTAIPGQKGPTEKLMLWDNLQKLWIASIDLFRISNGIKICILFGKILVHVHIHSIDIIAWEKITEEIATTHWPMLPPV